MSGSLPQTLIFGLMMLTAAGYAVATIGMKLSSAAHSWTALTIIALGLAGAAFAEITLLRQASLPMVYLGIVVVETLIVMTYAAWSHEGISAAQIGGAALVLAGFVMVSSNG